MRLVSAYIENFGKLQKYSVSFTDGVNTVYEENGWGKSTLLAFIRVMLYGFGNEKARKETENERKRYTPWQGGTYGGNLVFESGGRVYRAERTFEKKNDTFALYDHTTNREASGFSENLGEELFGLNRESFSRSVFIGQQDCGTEVTAQISAKVGNVSGEAADMAMFQKAVQALHDESNRLTESRATGVISKLKNEISALQVWTAKREACEETHRKLLEEIADCRRRIAQRRGRIAELNILRDQMSRYHAVLAEKQEYETLKEEAARAKEEYDALRGRFGEKVPDIGELDALIRAAGESERLARELGEDGTAGSDSARELGALERRFGGGAPDEEDLDRLLAQGQELDGLRQSVLERQGRIREMRFLLQDEARREAEREQERRILEELYRRKRRDSIALVLLIAGIAVNLAASGSYLAFELQGGFYWLVVALGTGLTAAGIVLKCRGDRAESELDWNEAAGDGQKQKGEGWSGDESEGEFADPPEIRAQEELLAREEQRLGEIRGELGDFLEKFGIFCEENRIREALYGLRRDAEDYRRLAEKRKHTQEEREALRERIDAFCEEYTLAISGEVRMFTDLRDGLLWMEDRKAKLGEREEKLRRFEAEHETEKYRDLVRPESEKDLSGIAEETERLERENEADEEKLKAYEPQLRETDEKLEQITEAQSRVWELTEECERARYRARIVRLTEELLVHAKDRFLLNYLAPMQDRFDRYYALLTGSGEDEYDLDTNFNVTKKEGGQSRNIDLLSEGYRDLVGLCRRMAMVEVMYREEKPFLIFDDPFVNLDDEKVRRGLDFLEKIGAEYQVIYTTCSGGRVGS